VSDAQIITVELSTPNGTRYYATHGYTSYAGDAIPAQQFLPNLIDDVEFDRRVGAFLFNESPRGSSNWGVIRINNAAGGADDLVSESLRDQSVVIKRGGLLASYDSFVVVAQLIVDKIVFGTELALDVYVTDIGAQLQRAAQTTLYPETLSNSALRQKPVPFAIGRVYQVPLIETSTEGNRHLDVHDTDLWLGVDAVMDNGAFLLPSLDDVESTAPVTNSYRRSLQSGANGIERRSAVGGRETANVQGALNVLATPLNSDGSTLTGWTVVGGGVAGRDVTIKSGGFRILNTTAILLGLTHSIVNTSAATDVWWYSFTVIDYTSGYLTLKPGGSVERQIKEPGKFSGVFQRSANFQFAIEAPASSNCDMIIDNIILRKVSLIEKISDVVKYLVTSDGVTGARGPLTLAQVDTAALAELEAVAPYTLGYYLEAQQQIADVMDGVMNSFGGWWYISRLGLLTVGRLEAAAGTPVRALDQSHIMNGLSIEMDDGKGVSNRIAAQKNWAPYQESEVVASLNAVGLDPVAHGPNVTISGGNRNWSNTGAGAARSVPLIFGDRLYCEAKVTAVGVGGTAAIGQQGLRALLTTAPGINIGSAAYRANGQKWRDNVASAYGAALAVDDVVGCAVDFRPAARGQSANGLSGRIWFSKNGVWQASGDPTTDTAPAFATLSAAHLAFLAAGSTGSGVAGTINFGHGPFAYTPPDEFDAPASQKSLVTSAYRYQYQSGVALAAPYKHALSSSGLSAAFDARAAQQVDGVPTLLSGRADARTECDRWAGLYSATAFFYQFDALLDSPAAVDQIEPGDLISVTHPRYGLSGKLMRVLGVKGALLSGKVTIRARG